MRQALAGIRQLYDENHHEAHEAHEPEEGRRHRPGVGGDEAYDLILEKLDEQKQKNKLAGRAALIMSIISWIDSMNWLAATATSIPFKADICGAPTHPFRLC
ncbi:MAG: hypothetical protein ACLTMP_04220 [Eggerthella lenta]